MTRKLRLKKDWRDTKGILSRGTPEKDRHSTAIHEAGHAVLAHRLGQRVQWLVLASDCPYAGATSVFYKSQKGKIDPLVMGIVALAGHEAEHLVYQRPITKLPAEDYKTIVMLGFSPDSISVVGKITRRLSCTFEKDIRRVAKALLKTDSLNRRQFLKVIREAGPGISG